MSRANTFAASIRDFRSVTLLSVGSPSGVSGFLTTPQRADADTAALNLAQAVSGRAEPVTSLPDLSGTRRVGVVRVDLRAAAGRATQSGADPAETSRRIALAMRSTIAAPAGGPDEQCAPTWVAASVRKPTNGERRRTLRWYAHRLGNNSPVHHVMDNQSVIVSISSGGDDPVEIKQRLNQIVAALPGFDIAVKVRMMRPWLAGLWWVLAGMLGGVGSYLLHRPLWQQICVLLAGLVLFVATAVGFLPTQPSRTIRRARAGVFDPPARKVRRTAKPKKGSSPEGGRKTKESAGDYPMVRENFLVGPALLVGLVAPHAGAASGSAVTERRAASAAMLDAAIGPLVGTAGSDDTQVHVCAPDMETGTLAVGRPSSGKSVLMRHLFAWSCLERVTPSGRPGFPGKCNTLIAFESKGDGAPVYRRWSDTLGDKTLMVEVADPNSFAIDVFDLPGTLTERARLFANMLVYAFDDGAIQGQSFESLELTLSGGLVVTDAIADQAGVPTGRSPIFYCHLLLGGQGDLRGKALAAAISEAATRAQKAKDPTAGDLGTADDTLAKIYASTVTESARRAQTQAARNKIGDMMAAESWWSPSRRKVTWRQIVTGHKSVIINTGVSTAGHQLDERIGKYLTALLTYSLIETIKRNCSGWKDAGRYISIFSDELSLMAGASSETLTWLHDQGRSYGVRPFLATQRLYQLPAMLSESLTDYATVYWFAQASASASEKAAAELAVDGSGWDKSDITGLEPYNAIIRTHVRQIRQPAVPVLLSSFESNMAAFAAAQGYPPPPAGKHL